MKQVHRHTLFAAVVLVCLSACTFLSAQSTITNRNSTISGFVFDETRRPIGQVVVELLDEYNSIVRRTRTQPSGRYLFTGLVQGRYNVRVRPFGTGLREQSEEVEISGVGMSGRQLADNAIKDVYLQADRKTVEKMKNAVVFAQEVPPEAEKFLRNGSENIDRQNVDAGIQQLEKAIEIFPNYLLALQKLGYVRLMSGNFAAAESLFERAIRINADSFESLYGLGISQLSLRKLIEAIATFEKAILKRPDSFESHLALGMALRENKQYTEAEKAFRQAVKVSDDTVASEAYWNLALLYAHNLGKFGEAAKQLELYLKVSPDAPNKEAIKKLIKEYKGKAQSAE